MIKSITLINQTVNNMYIIEYDKSVLLYQTNKIPNKKMIQVNTNLLFNDAE